MVKVLAFTAATAVTAALVTLAYRAFGPDSAWFAFFVVWLPMAWLGTVGRVVTPRLPERYHVLRRFEAEGRLYEAVGVRVFKRALRRGPLAVFNPDLHLPADERPESLSYLDQRMRDAEASHFILFVALVGVAGNAARRGWWTAASLTVLFNVLMNGYPVVLQRYNRILLRQRYGDFEASRDRRP